jgi:TRAP-type mannitol/chloroaromatic compound transport system permease large subunit
VFDGLGAVQGRSRAVRRRDGARALAGPDADAARPSSSSGIFLDDTAMLVIVAPLFIPLAGALGFSLIWYGVLYTITCQIAYLTPPFGYNLFLMRAMAPPDYTLTDIYKSVYPFVWIMLLTLLIIVMVFPQIATWLPNYYYSK